MTSSYFQSLDPPTHKRYREKIELLGQVDPYDIQECDLAEDVESLPEVTYPILSIILYLHLVLIYLRI